ncbi:hypothetical protein [Aurantivibrio infirmus]
MLLNFRDAFSGVLVYVIAGIVLGIINAILRQPIFLLLAMASFVLVPTMASSDSFDSDILFWLSCFVSAMGVLSIREFSRDSDIKEK